MSLPSSSEYSPHGESGQGSHSAHERPLLNRVTADIQALEDRSRARRSIPLSGILAPVVTFGSGLWNALMRIIRTIVTAVGRKFQVGAEVSGAKSAEPVAHLTAPSGSPTDVANVEQAAQEIAQESQDLVATILASKPDVAKLGGPQAQAYASLRLQEIGGALQQMRAQLDTEYVSLHMQVQDHARKVGLNVDELLKYLKESALDDLEVRRDFPASLLDAYDRHSRLRSDICSLQLQFCTFAIAALRKDKSTVQEGYGQMLEELIGKYADEDMRNIIQEQIDRQADNTNNGDTPIDGLSGVQSGKHNMPGIEENVHTEQTQASSGESGQEAAPLPPVTVLSRAKRFAVGVDPGRELSAEVDDEPRVVERQR
jgi:hypothetical protein